MSWHTKVPVLESFTKVNQSQKLLFLGSCFSDSIGSKFQKAGLSAVVNPFGVLYNPTSVLNLLDPNFEIQLENEKNFSFDIQKNFSSQEHLISELKFFNDHLLKTDWLFLTFGTSEVYFHKEQKKIVANCHRQPQQFFEKQFLTLNKMIEDWKVLLKFLKSQNSDLKVVFTVSPIRHTKSGMIGNQRSKAKLILLVQELEETFDFVSYFPAYEIVQDELRDYRFYKEDMVHPSNAAIDYIWSKFSENYCDLNLVKLLAEVHKLREMEAHRIQENPTSADLAHEKRCKKHRLAIEAKYNIRLS